MTCPWNSGRMCGIRLVEKHLSVGGLAEYQDALKMASNFILLPTRCLFHRGKEALWTWTLVRDRSLIGTLNLG